MLVAFDTLRSDGGPGDSAINYCKQHTLPLKLFIIVSDHLLGAKHTCPVETGNARMFLAPNRLSS